MPRPGRAYVMRSAGLLGISTSAPTSCKKSEQRKMKRLKWGETPWDDLPGDDLLREVQRIFWALQSARSVLGILKVQNEESSFWGKQGSGGRALDRSFTQLPSSSMCPMKRNGSFARSAVVCGAERVRYHMPGFPAQRTR